MLNKNKNALAQSNSLSSNISGKKSKIILIAVMQIDLPKQR